MKIIDLYKIIKQKEDDANMDWFKQGFNELAALPEKQADKIVTFIVNYLLLEIKVNIGLVKVEPEIMGDKELFRFSEAAKNLFLDNLEGRAK